MRRYRIQLDAQGKFYSPDYGITKDTLDELKVEIRSETRKKLPKQDVWVLGDHYTDEDDLFIRATTTGMIDSRNDWYIWITKQGGRKEREKVRYTTVYPCNERNDALVEQYNTLCKQRRAIAEQQHNVQDQMTSITPLDEEGQPVKDE